MTQGHVALGSAALPPSVVPGAVPGPRPAPLRGTGGGSRRLAPAGPALRMVGLAGWMPLVVPHRRRTDRGRLLGRHRPPRALDGGPRARRTAAPLARPPCTSRWVATTAPTVRLPDSASTAAASRSPHRTAAIGSGPIPAVRSASTGRPAASRTWPATRCSSRTTFRAACPGWCSTTGPLPTWSLSVTPHLVDDAEGPDRRRRHLTRCRSGATSRSGSASRCPPTPPRRGARRLDAVLPWFAHDALVHYLSPRGLEQYTGGAWGTRDVCQGPVGVLLAARRAPRRCATCCSVAARAERPRRLAAVLRLPTARLASGTSSDSHGDVVYWPLLALGDYLLRHRRRARSLDDAVPFVGDRRAHRAGAAARPPRPRPGRDRGRRVPGTPLPAYGHGDWNDSLQPADPALARADSVSTWTVVLQAQALSSLADGLRDPRTPRPTSRAGPGGPAHRRRRRRRAARGLLVDGVLAGLRAADETAGSSSR